MSHTTTVTDASGNEFEVPTGADGENPVTPDNPPAKAIAGAPDTSTTAYQDSASPDAETIQEKQELHAKIAEENTGTTDAGQSGGAEEPAKNASTDDWRTYAVSQGASEDEVKDASRDDLIEKYGSKD